MCSSNIPIIGPIFGGLFGSMNQPAMQAASAAAAPASQAAKAPDEAAMRKAAAALAGPSIQSTMLTGPAGVNPSLLSLGKNTLLGG